MLKSLSYFQENSILNTLKGKRIFPIAMSEISDPKGVSDLSTPLAGFLPFIS